MKKTVILSLHLGYWLLYALLLVIVYFAGSSSPGYPTGALAFRIVLMLCVLPAVMGFYSFYAILFPYLLQRKRIALLFVGGLLTASLCGLFSVFLITVVFRSYKDVGILYGQMIFMGVIALLNGGMALIIRGFIGWYGDIRIKEELSTKNHEMEMALVKSRLHPHFLFNTINNIDVLIRKDTEKASDYLMKLSDIMRFMLYETRAEKIALSKELEYINKYIELQKIRTTNMHYVNYTVTGNREGIVIAPMLFIPFIENAFKHAGNKKTEHAIDIRFTIRAKTIIFECVNVYSEGQKNEQDFGGLGNELIVKRLALMYPDRHMLDITDSNGIYKVKLEFDYEDQLRDH